MRRHSYYKTWEFRCFAPCEHKVENVETFLDYFCKAIDKVKLKKEVTITLKDTITTKLAYKHKLDLAASRNLNYAEIINDVSTERLQGYAATYNVFQETVDAPRRRIDADTLRFVDPRRAPRNINGDLF